MSAALLCPQPLCVQNSKDTFAPTVGGSLLPVPSLAFVQGCSKQLYDGRHRLECHNAASRPPLSESASRDTEL